MSSYSQLPGRLNLLLKAGDDFSTTVDFDVSLSGYTVSSHVVSVSAGGTVAQITSTISNASAGQVTMTMSDTQTSTLPPGSYGWRLVWDSPNGDRRTPLEGFLEVVR